MYEIIVLNSLVAPTRTVLQLQDVHDPGVLWKPALHEREWWRSCVCYIEGIVCSKKIRVKCNERYCSVVSRWWIFRLSRSSAQTKSGSTRLTGSFRPLMSTGANLLWQQQPWVSYYITTLSSTTSFLPGYWTGSESAVVDPELRGVQTKTWKEASSWPGQDCKKDCSCLRN